MTNRPTPGKHTFSVSWFVRSVGLHVAAAARASQALISGPAVFIDRNSPPRYLLEATPGLYAIVGAAITTQVQASTATHAYFFSEAAVRASTFTVAPGKLTVVGGAFFDFERGLENADAVQKHYAELLAPGSTAPKKGVVATIFNFTHRGSFKELDKNKQVIEELVQEARKDLTESGWAKRLQ